MSSNVYSHDLPGQAMGPSSPSEHLCTRSKSSIITKHHQRWNFQPLIPHKQNPHKEINQLPVTAKIISQPGIQCVASVAIQSWQTDCNRLHEIVPWIVQHSVHICTQIIIVIARDLARQCVRVLQQRTLPTVCMQSNNMAIWLYTGNGSDNSNDCAKLSYKNCKKSRSYIFE
jgi:hypothetical protein